MDLARKQRQILSLDVEAAAASERRGVLNVGHTGIWPLNAPGMAPPGSDFLTAAKLLGDEETVYKKSKGGAVYEPGPIIRDLYRRALREPGFRLNVETKGGHRSEVEFVPGHIWGQNYESWTASTGDTRVQALPVDGPRRADIMVLGKMLGREEVREHRNLVGMSGEIFTTVIDRLHIRDAMKWYVTNLVKFAPPEGVKWRAGWVKQCRPLLDAELRIVRPKYILCLGADTSKELLGAKFTVSYMEGRVIEHKYAIHLNEDDEPEEHTAMVMTVLHPAQVVRAPDQERILERGMSRFALLIGGKRFDLEEQGLDHRVCDTLEDAEEWVQEVDAEFADLPLKDRLIGWDAEWHGSHPINAGSYIRTIQLSWGEKKAICFKMAHAGGRPAFRDRDGKLAAKRLATVLNDFMVDKRAVGHFFNADLEWLQHYGINPIASCPIPLEDEGNKLAWERFRDGEGWLDTSAMVHAIEETAPLGLESVTLRYTTVPRYDIELQDWKKEYCKQKGIAQAALEGYGEVSDRVLIPYANFDADATLRAAKELFPLLAIDYVGNCCWEACWETMLAMAPILEMQQTGIEVDRDRVDDLTESFVSARAVQEEKVRGWAKWDDFNIRSVQQVREFLFGEALNGKDFVDGQPVSIRRKRDKAGVVKNPDAISLYVEPLLDTSKPPRRWKDLCDRNLHHLATPGTGKVILSILAQENLQFSDQIGWIRDHRFLDQALKSLLRPPAEADGNWIVNDDGNYEYEAGIVAALDCDGRVRTHLSPTAETGRWRSWRPNLQASAKQRDADYERMLGAGYKHKIRSIFRARAGHALIEFDYTGAELFVAAIMSGSKTMIEHCLRGQLKKSDPNYYDIHANVAVLAFRLNCVPSESGLAAIGKKHFRVLAKNVVFGLMYGRGAKAIALQCKEMRIDVSVEESQHVIDTVFDMYPELQPFFEECKRRAREDRWLCNCFGRFRRVPVISDYKLEGEFERQFLNFPEQSAVASAVNRGLATLQYLRDHKLKRPDLFRMLLQMHDAGLVESPFANVAYLTKELIPYAMRDCVPIYPTDLAGIPTGTGPYYLGLDVSVHRAWGEPYTRAECEANGIPTEFAGKD